MTAEAGVKPLEETAATKPLDALKQSIDAGAETPQVRTVLLKDQGPRLPLGIPDTGGTFRTDLVCRPWTMREEKKLGDIQDKNRDLTLFQHVGVVLALMYERLGPYDFTSMKLEERRLRIGQFYMGDVYYAYIWLRTQAMGSELLMDLTCSRCGSPLGPQGTPFPADLESIELTTSPTLDPFLWSYDLYVPLEIRGKTVRTLHMGPPIWNALEGVTLDGGMNVGAAKAEIIRAAIVEVEGLGHVALTETELDGMVKRDIERIQDLLDEHHLGPDMAVEGSCPRCRRPFKLPIDWGYASFFGSSSP